jgi:Helicase conserved C-terminal domain
MAAGTRVIERSAGFSSPCQVVKESGSSLQEERTTAFVQFSRCEKGALFCTDVAARGLDFPAVSTVIQFDAPGELSEYASAFVEPSTILYPLPLSSSLRLFHVPTSVSTSLCALLLPLSHVHQSLLATTLLSPA